jgi:hypothetical protein
MKIVLRAQQKMLKIKIRESRNGSSTILPSGSGADEWWGGAIKWLFSGNFYKLFV